jgi:hypothetical protein
MKAHRELAQARPPWDNDRPGAVWYIWYHPRFRAMMAVVHMVSPAFSGNDEGDLVPRLREVPEILAPVFWLRSQQLRSMQVRLLMLRQAISAAGLAMPGAPTSAGPAVPP